MVSSRAASVSGALLVGALVLARCREQSSPRPAPSAVPPVDSLGPANTERFSSGPLSARLVATARSELEIEFFNSSPTEVTVLRPGLGEPLVAVPGLPGMQALPAAVYRFQALGLRDKRVRRGAYAPLFGTGATSERGRPNGATAEPFLDYWLKVPAHGAARVSVELPFQPEPGDYWLLFSYDYFLSSRGVPPGWFTGQVEAPPIRISADAQGKLSASTQQGTDEALALSVGRAGLGLMLKAISPGVIEARFTNPSPAPRGLELPVDRAASSALLAPELKWEATSTTTGHVFRRRVGLHTPRPTEPESSLPPDATRPEAPPTIVVVVPPRGELNLRLDVPLQLPSGDYQLRLGYENLVVLSAPGDDTVAGSVVSPPLLFSVGR